MPDSKPNAVIGCGKNSHYCGNKCSIHPTDKFFSINIAPKADPDKILDITTADFPQELINSFNIVLLEHLPFFVYNPAELEASQEKEPSAEHNLDLTGFKNIMSMAKDDGFIVILGSSRHKNCRHCLKDLKYIELPVPRGDKSYLCILSKNQDLSIGEVNNQINANNDLKCLIYNITAHLNTDKPYEFCPILYDSMPTMQEEAEQKETQLIAQKEEKEAISRLTLTNHKKIPAIANFYSTLDALKEHNNEIYNTLKTKADSFFKNTPSYIHENLTEFKRSFAQSAQKAIPDPIKQQQDKIGLIIANILIALTGIGLIAIGINACYKKQTTGYFLPLFFEVDRNSVLTKINIERCIYNTNNISLISAH